ncbi:MAG: radical SAM protein [Clostridia bacterium]
MRRYKKAYIEITNICNLNCKFCPKTTRKPKSMSYDEFKYVLNEVSKYADYINLHQMGEPLLHKDVQMVLYYQKKKL